MKKLENSIIYSLNDILKFTESKYSVFLQKKLLEKTEKIDFFKEKEYTPSPLEKIMQISGVMFEKTRTISFINEQKSFRDLFLLDFTIKNRYQKIVGQERNKEKLQQFIDTIPDQIILKMINKKQVAREDIEDQIKIIRKRILNLLEIESIDFLIEKYKLFNQTIEEKKYIINQDKNGFINIKDEKSIDDLVENSLVAYIEDPGKDYNLSHKLTLKLMEKGVSIIIQGVLKYNKYTIIGIADLLVKNPIMDEKNAKINNQNKKYYYEVKDIKRSFVDKPKFIIQNCCYSDMLNEMQCYKTKKGEILLGNYSSDIFNLADYMFYYHYVLRKFIDTMNNKSEFEPSKMDFSNNGNIEKKYSKKLESIPNISQKEILLLNKNLVFNIDDLLKIRDIRGFEKSNLERIKKQAICNKYYQTLNIKFNVNLIRKRCLLYERIESNKKVIQLDQYKTNGYNLENFPSFTHNDIILDVKITDSFEKEEFICYFNILYYENNLLKTKQYHCIYSRNESSILAQAIFFLKNIVKNEGKIYLYNNELIKTLLDKCSQYSIQVSFVYKLIFDNRIIGLYDYLVNNFIFGSDEINLKNLTKYVRHNIPQCVIDESFDLNYEAPLLSIIYFPKSKEEKESKLSYQEQLQKNSDYKMLFLYFIILWINNKKQYLKENSDYEENIKIIEDNEDYFKENKISILPDLKETVKEEAEIDFDSFEKIKFKQKDYEKMNNEEKVKLLISQLDEFIINENKVSNMENRKIDLQGMGENVFNNNCLNNLRPFKQKIMNKRHYITYYYNNFEETKINVGDKVKIIGQKKYANIIKMDKNSITLEFNKEVIPENISIMKHSIISSNVLLNEIYKIQAKVLSKNNEEPYLGLNKCIYDFLMKKNPDFNNYERYDDSDELGSNIIEEGTKALKQLNNSFIIFQGPPGTGKSYTSAHIILNLINEAEENNKSIKIGISSNSHKAIDGLLLKICEEANKKNVNINIFKYFSKTKDNSELINSGIKNANENNKNISIVGGTVFNMFKEELDYLFIDEAGQVSITNMIIMAKNAKNLILIGDQQQLEQPIQAIHPGDSGKSVLEYYLDGYSVIPYEKGFFLPISRRMCKDLCQEVSNFFYENRLISEEELYLEIENLPFEFSYKLMFNNSIINKQSGLIFFDVPHKNNLTSSDEEVDYIKTLINDLKKQQIIEKGNIRNIQAKDIIIVSPFNSQVNKLKNEFKDINVGSVDLFQGQEAPIVIYSLACSDASNSRGIEFLLNPNRMNVALSRGKALAILVGSSEILNTKATNIQQLKLLNMFAKLIR